MRGKKYKSAIEKIGKDKSYSIGEALKLIKENQISKFNESVEIHINSNIDPKKGDQQIRGSVVLPHGTGKIKKIAVVTSTKDKEAKDAKADLVKGEDLVEDIKKGKINFDVLIATPEMMPKLAQVAKVLGPKGMMPNPKTGTVTDKVKEAIEMIKKGKADFKNDNTGNVHQVIGKISFEENQLEENFDVFMKAVKKSKGEGVKGKLINKVVVCSTMSPGIRIEM